MYVCMQVCVCVCMHVSKYVCMYIRTYVCMRMYVQCMCIHECIEELNDLITSLASHFKSKNNNKT